MYKDTTLSAKNENRSVLQIRRDKKDNLGIIFQISPVKPML